MTQSYFLGAEVIVSVLDCGCSKVLSGPSMLKQDSTGNYECPCQHPGSWKRGQKWQRTSLTPAKPAEGVLIWRPQDRNSVLQAAAG